MAKQTVTTQNPFYKKLRQKGVSHQQALKHAQTFKDHQFKPKKSKP